MAKILIVGCGAIGTGLGLLLQAAGHEVTGVKRSPPPLAERQFTYFQADITSMQEVEALSTEFDRIFFIVSANRKEAESYQKIYKTGINHLFDHFSDAGTRPPLIFVSSTSVYAQSQGEWVDENSPALGDSPSSRFIVSAENDVLAYNPASIIVRFSGIYGPGREYLLKRAAQTPVIQQTPPYYTNRIHERDCIHVLAFLLKQSLSGANLSQCYLASDDDPAPLWEVMSWLAEQMGATSPEPQKMELDANRNKRCSNASLKNLGYRFIYSNYRSGYTELVHSAKGN